MRFSWKTTPASLVHAPALHLRLEGCVWAWARALGLDCDRLRCAVAAEILRRQPEGWQQAVVEAVGTLNAGPDAD